MPYNETRSREELRPSRLRERLGDVSQFACVREVRLGNGSEDGVRALDVRVAGGIDALVIADRGLDIGPAWHRGYPLHWASPTGIVHPSYTTDETWLRTFHGGLLVTAGLQNVGPPCVDEGETHGLHGRISSTPARNVRWEIGEEGATPEIEIHGDVRETSVYGADLLLRRRLRFAVGEPSLSITDVVENRGFGPAALMILYHFNIGHPIVDGGAKFFAPPRDTLPRDEVSALALERHATFSAPARDAPAEVYEHRLRDPGEKASVGIVNERYLPAGGVGVAIRYRPSQLPRLWQWRMLARGMYLTGIEPANCGVGGRAAERAAGTLDVLEPGDRRTFELEVEAAQGGEAVARLAVA